MRIVKQDLKSGLVRIRIESPDDLWTLRTVIRPGDSLRGSTERKIKLGNAKDEKSNVVRKRVTLTINAEKSEYTPGALRVLGTISDSPEDVPRGEHHSFGLEPGSEVTIVKREWPGYLLAKVKQATVSDTRLLVLLFDREEAKLYGVTRQGIEELTRLKGSVAKKALDEGKAANFYKEIVAQVEEYVKRGYKHVIAGAPAFWKEYLSKELPDGLRKITVLTTISAVERTAIREILARPEVMKLLKESSTLREMALVEEALTALGKEKLAYGIKEVTEAINTGNAMKIIVTENHIEKEREKEKFAPLEQLLRTAEGMKAEVHILAAEEAMPKIDGLGGVVAIKRW